MFRKRLALAIVLALLAAAGLVACGSRSTSSPSDMAPQTIEVGAVSVAVTPESLDATGAVFRLVLDTHAVELDTDLPGTARLSVGGRDWPAASWEGDGPGGHHREGVLRFRPAGPPAGDVVLSIAGLPGPAEFRWAA